MICIKFNCGVRDYLNMTDRMQSCEHPLPGHMHTEIRTTHFNHTRWLNEAKRINNNS